VSLRPPTSTKTLDQDARRSTLDQDARRSTTPPKACQCELSHISRHSQPNQRLEHHVLASLQRSPVCQLSRQPAASAPPPAATPTKPHRQMHIFVIRSDQLVCGGPIDFKAPPPNHHIRPRPLTPWLSVALQPHSPCDLPSRRPLDPQETQKRRRSRHVALGLPGPARRFIHSAVALNF
jgi:hypothetical protein